MSVSRNLSTFTCVTLLAVISACSDGDDYYGGASTATSSSSSSSSASARFPAIDLNGVASGFTQPLQITHAGDGSGRLFVVQRNGRIMTVKNSAVSDQPFLDVSDRITTDGGEQGLLGLAFPPDYAEKRYFYINYTNLDGDTVVSRLASDGGDENTLLTVRQPYANHNGGQIAFGPDGYLYVALGDGGDGGDPHGNGQNRDTMLGSILRIDVESVGSQYAIPEDNPFNDAVWAYGLRNPWRFSFDSATGDLFIADVGGGMYEEINFQPADSQGGENYGWNIMEGTECFGSLSCDQSGLVLPVAGYDHQEGDCSVTGGYVYRGRQYDDMQGLYIYGDYCSGKIWGLREINGDWETRLLRDTDLRISSFGRDQSGNLYLTGYAAGTVYKIDQSIR